MTFTATLKITLHNVIDEEAFREHYKGNARSMLLDIFDGPVDMAMNADDALLVAAEPTPSVRDGNVAGADTGVFYTREPW